MREDLRDVALPQGEDVRDISRSDCEYEDTRSTIPADNGARDDVRDGRWRDAVETANDDTLPPGEDVRGTERDWGKDLELEPWPT